MKDGKASPKNLLRHLNVLTGEIGVRLAGSAGERAAADYIQQACRAHGAQTAVEEVPVWERRVESETLEILIGDQWRSFPCSLFGGAPSTGVTPFTITGAESLDPKRK